MTQIVPAMAVLGPGKTGLTIGYRVLNLDGTTYATFSTMGVAETSTAGTYRKANGVAVPDAGGYIVWGTALVDYAEATVDSAIATSAIAAIATAVAAEFASVGVVPINDDGAVYEDLLEAIQGQVNDEVVDVLRTDTIPDSYATDGDQPTIAQAILGIHQFLMERAVSGTTVTVKKPDGNTVAMTFTLDDESNPTAITRAS